MRTATQLALLAASLFLVIVIQNVNILSILTFKRSGKVHISGPDGMVLRPPYKFYGGRPMQLQGSSYASWAVSCDPEHAHYGCKLQADKCICVYGCKYEYPYRNKGECKAAYRERNSNICNHNPCVRGTCLQVNQEPGYSCRCEGTGFYGQRCEKVCPTIPIRGLSFPYECIVI